MRLLIILILNVLCAFAGVAQSQLLERRVTLQYQQARLATVLAAIRQRYGVGFSYANNHIPLDKKVNLSVTDVPLAEALNTITQQTGLQYTLVAGQIVLTKGPVAPPRPKPAPKPTQERPATGKSINDTSLEPMQVETDLSETASLLPVPVLYVQKADGQEKDREELKKDYLDEKRTLRKNYLSQMDAAIETGDSTMASNLARDFRRLEKNLKAQFQSLKSKAAKLVPDMKATAPDSGANRMQPAQISVVPPLSTNGAQNRYTTNRISFNLLVGHAGGVKGFELGGLVNVETGNVKGGQVGGVMNLVKGDVNGTQVAGVMNSNQGRLEGVQISGAMTVSGSDSSNAVQVSGFGNVHKGDLQGVQTAGFMNVNGGYMIGPQVAGFMNVNKGPLSGAQVAGFMNVGNQNLKGSQVAGFLNIAGSQARGTQFAGFMNVARKGIRGAQVAGFLNVGHNVKGSQVGFINIADTISGIQFGLLNFCRNGYRRLEVFGMESMHANIAFKMGSRKFYNIFAGGINPLETKPHWSYGYGFGTERILLPTLVLNLEGVCNRVFEDKNVADEELNLLNQLKINVAWRPAKHFGVFAGPVANVMVSRVQNKETGVVGSSIIPDWTSYDKTTNGTRVAIWAGFNAGICF